MATVLQGGGSGKQVLFERTIACKPESEKILLQPDLGNASEGNEEPGGLR
jgi:hypothetical protein